MTVHLMIGIISSVLSIRMVSDLLEEAVKVIAHGQIYDTLRRLEQKVIEVKLFAI